MERAIRHISTRIKEIGELTDEQEEIVVYSLQWILLSILSTLGVVVLGWLLGVAVPVIAAAAASGTLRLVSGGAHYSSINRCSIVSSITFPLIAFLGVRIPEELAVPIAVVTIAVATLVVLRFAPVDNEAKPIREERRPLFRAASLVVLFAWACGLWLVTNPGIMQSISLALLWQTLSLTPAGRVVFGGIDRMLGGEGVQR